MLGRNRSFFYSERLMKQLKFTEAGVIRKETSVRRRESNLGRVKEFVERKSSRQIIISPFLELCT